MALLQKDRRLLISDLSILYANFISSKLDDGIESSVEIDPVNSEYIWIKNFPLPKRRIFGSHPYINMAVDIIGYPHHPPAGVHLPREDQNTPKVRDALGGHILDYDAVPYKEVAEFDQRWVWVCYHYDDWSWDFNPRDLSDGDSIASYLMSLHVEIDKGV